MARAKIVLNEPTLKWILGLTSDVDIRALDIMQDPIHLEIVISHNSIKDDWHYPEGVGAESRIYDLNTIPASIKEHNL